MAQKMLEEELKRYKRQLSIPGFGIDAQRRLKASRAVLFGAGGVGCAAALYLAAAGIGSLVLIDKDIVSLHNLNRQILYTSSDVGKKKAPAAAERLKAFNPYVEIEVVAEEVGAEKISALVEEASFILDTFDCNEARLSVNAASIKHRIAAVHGFAQDMGGEMIGVLPGRTACLNCVLDESYPELKNVPVLGVTAGIIGLQMASAAIKYLTGCGVFHAGCRIIWDLVLDQFLCAPLLRRPECPSCARI